MHRVMCHGREVTLFFEHAVNHAFTEEYDPMVHAAADIIRRRIGPSQYDDRVFSLDRARLMDHIIPAVKYYSFTIPGTGPSNRNNRLVHGPRLPDGRYLRVALSPGPRGSWYCKSAYPIEAAKWMALRGAKTAKFPP